MVENLDCAKAGHWDERVVATKVVWRVAMMAANLALQTAAAMVCRWAGWRADVSAARLVFWKAERLADTWVEYWVVMKAVLWVEWMVC